MLKFIKTFLQVWCICIPILAWAYSFERVSVWDGLFGILIGFICAWTVQVIFKVITFKK